MWNGFWNTISDLTPTTVNKTTSGDDNQPNRFTYTIFFTRNTRNVSYVYKELYKHYEMPLILMLRLKKHLREEGVGRMEYPVLAGIWACLAKKQK
jgi:hypothetical protein